MSSPGPAGPEVDPLGRLEERVLQAAAQVAALRREAAEARALADRLSGELETLRKERAQVRLRIENLIGKMDELGGI
ncbi:MAG: cell division protein ZapB [Bryobacterales bacterium]|nr:cell division protein ZapB [Bryobacterales bacterium]